MPAVYKRTIQPGLQAIMPKGIKNASGPNLPMRRIANRFIGRAVWNHHPFGDHVQAWPRKRGKKGTPAQLAARADFRRMVDAVKNTSNADKVGAMMIAQGSSYTWRDVLSRQVTGTLIEIDYNGTEAAVMKSFLDTLGVIPGLILVCTADGWEVLSPGTDGQVLELVGGVPAWVTPSGGGGGGIAWADLIDQGSFNDLSSYAQGSIVQDAGFRYLNVLAVSPGGLNGWDLSRAGTVWAITGSFNEIATYNTSVSYKNIIGVNAAHSGKLYFEIKPPNPSVDGGSIVGLALAALPASSNSATSQLGNTQDSFGLDCYGGASMRWNLNSVQSYSGLARYNATHVLAFAIDMTAKLAWVRDVDAGTPWYGNNGTGDPTAGTNGFDFSGVSAGDLFAGYSNAGDGAAAITINAGTAAFAGAVPTDYAPLGSGGGTLLPPGDDPTHWVELGVGTLPVIRSAVLSTDLVISPTPTSATAISGLHIDLPASADARTVLVNTYLVCDPCHARLGLMLDGVQVVHGMRIADDSDGVSTQMINGYPIVIPGDNAAHVVATCVAAQGSTSATTVLGSGVNQSSLTLIDPV